MKNKNVSHLLSICLVILLYNGLYAQELMRSAIVSSGSFNSSGQYSLSNTIGEVITQTQAKNQLYLTQGFQQSDDLGIISATGEVNLVELNLEIYPNPVSEELKISLNVVDNTIRLYHINGRLVLSASGQNQYKLRLKGLLPGMYFLEIVLDHGMISKPLIKI